MATRPQTSSGARPASCPIAWYVKLRSARPALSGGTSAEAGQNDKVLAVDPSVGPKRQFAEGRQPLTMPASHAVLWLVLYRRTRFHERRISSFAHEQVLKWKPSWLPFGHRDARPNNMDDNGHERQLHTLLQLIQAGQGVDTVALQ